MPRYQAQTTGILAGLNEDENPLSLRDDELTVALNVARTGNMLGTRPGLTALGSGEDYENQLSEAAPIQGMHEYRTDFDANRTLIVVSEGADASGTKSSGGGEVFTDDGTALDLSSNSVVVTNGQDNAWTFDMHQNKLWAAGGSHTSGGTGDDIWYWDGTNDPDVLALADLAAQRIRPKFIKEFGGYLLINGMRGGTAADNNPLATRYMTFGTDPTSTNSWPTGNTIGFKAAALAGVGEFGSKFTTGFAEYEDNQGKWLLILGNNEIASVQLDPVNDWRVTDGISNGCVNQRAFVSLGRDSGDAVYMSNRGIHSLRQSQAHGFRQDSFISWKIRTTFSGLNQTRLDTSIGVYDRKNGRVLFAVSSGSDTKHDTILCLDVKDQDTITAEEARWSVWKLVGTPSGYSEKLTINSMIAARNSSNNWYIYAGTNTGDVIRFDEDSFSDLDTAYPVEIQTKHWDAGHMSTTKRVGDVYLALQPAGNYSITYQTIFDFGASKASQRQVSMNVESGAVWGTGVWGASEWAAASRTFFKKVYAAGSGTTISHSISHSTAGQPFRVGRVDFSVAGSGEEKGSEKAS